MASRRTKRRTGRKKNRSIKRSIKRDLEKSLRKKSLNKFNKRIKKYKKKKTKKKIQRGGAETAGRPSGEQRCEFDSQNPEGNKEKILNKLKEEYEKEYIKQYYENNPDYLKIMKEGAKKLQSFKTYEQLSRANDIIFGYFLPGGGDDNILKSYINNKYESLKPVVCSGHKRMYESFIDYVLRNPPEPIKEMLDSVFTRDEGGQPVAAAPRAGAGAAGPEGSEDCNLESDAVKLVEELKECRNKNDEYQQTINDLSGKIASGNAEIAINSQTIAGNDAEIAELISVIEKKNAELRAELDHRHTADKALAAQRDAANEEITRLTDQLRAVKEELDRLTAENRQLTEKNTELKGVIESLQAELDVVKGGLEGGEERANGLQAAVNNLIKKRICSLLGEVIIAIAVANSDINAQIDEHNKTRFIRGHNRGAVTWKQLLVSLMKYAKSKGYNMVEVLRLHEINPEEIDDGLSVIETDIVNAAIPEILQVRGPGQ